MSGLLLGGSLAAAYLAGAVALFAPCCITVLFPSYLAAAVRNHRWRLVPLTFVFAAGIAVVLVPITAGIGVLATSLLRFHSLVYALGGVLMLVFAAVVALGIRWSLPVMRGAPDISRTDSGGVFTLGVFSGAASACCAPVLAGVVTLSAIAPGPLAATGIGLAYVAGMVTPLVVLTLLWDRRGERFTSEPRPVTYRVGGRVIEATRLDLAVAAMFAVIGAGLLVVAATGASLTTDAQVRFGVWLAGRIGPLVALFEPIPDVVVGIALALLAVAAVVASGRRRSRPTSQSEPIEEMSCHD